jgi:hypothetical protein
VAVHHRLLLIASRRRSVQCCTGETSHHIGVCEYLCADGRRMYARYQQAGGFVDRNAFYQCLVQHAHTLYV